MKYAEFLQRTSFSKVELLACANGTLVDDPPPEGFATLPGPPMLMVDRVVEISHRGPQGRIVAEATNGGQQSGHDNLTTNPHRGGQDVQGDTQDVQTRRQVCGGEHYLPCQFG